jgi:hypothetical protein
MAKTLIQIQSRHETPRPTSGNESMKTPAEHAKLLKDFAADLRRVDLARRSGASPSPIASATMLDPSASLVRPSPTPSHERPTGSVGNFDLAFAKRLPQEARTILTEMADTGYEAKSTALQLHLRREDLRQEVGASRGRIAELTLNRAGYTSGVESSITKEREFLEERTAELARLEARLAQVGATAATFNQLIESARALVRRVGAAPITLHAGPPAQLRKGETATDAIESRRRRVRELEADFNRAKVAPQLSSTVKEREIARIEFLAKQGAPSAFAAIEEGREVIWPTTSTNLTDQIGSVVVPDFLAIVAHLNKAAMVEAVTREIDAMADDANALSDTARAEALAQIERDMLAIEREDAWFTRAVIAQGIIGLTYRGDTDPRALLNLSDDLPAPRRD